MIKWLTILIYWLWLEYRNTSAYKSSQDWKLLVQIVINWVVILAIVVEIKGV